MRFYLISFFCLLSLCACSSDSTRTVEYTYPETYESETIKTGPDDRLFGGLFKYSANSEELIEKMQKMSNNQNEETKEEVVQEKEILPQKKYWDKTLFVFSQYPIEQNDASHGLISTEWFNIEPKRQIKINAYVSQEDVKVNVLVRNYDATLGWINSSNDEKYADKIYKQITQEN
ncbi:MAG: DUF3576 domain-containing protein [Alphaproteobacteria bacterium]|nr:DUF3576 domain-containing protein [Alphaproteobacteria bacterium]